MLIETLKQTNSILHDSIQIKNDKQAAEAFKKQIIILNECLPKLEHLLKIIEILKSKQIATRILTTEIKDSLQTSVDCCGEKTNSHTLDAQTVQALKNAIELCKNATETAWKYAADMNSLSVIDSLKSLKGLLPDKNEAESILNTLEKAKIQMPTSTIIIDDFLKKVKRGKEIVDNLHLDDEVKTFIEKVKYQSATVSDLTPHIMKWLKDNNLMNVLKVRF